DGGAFMSGVVFEIPKTSGGYAATPNLLATFNMTNGASPYSPLISDANGDLFGTAVGGGTLGYGTVYELTGSGFVPPVHFAGIPGTPNCVGVSTSDLAHTYGGIAAAAKALGYAGVADLQNVIAGFCGTAR